MVVLLATGYLVIPFLFLRARWLWRYESFCVWRGVRGDLADISGLGRSIGLVPFSLSLPRCPLSLPTVWYRLPQRSLLGSLLFLPLMLPHPLSTLYLPQFFTSPLAFLILLYQRFRMVYLVSRFAQPLSRNLDFHVERCLGPVLLISQDGVRVFIRFLFLHLPCTPLYHHLEFHEVSHSNCPSASFACYLSLSAPSSSYCQFTTEDS
ncbi:hypothetical protein EDD16DRAFT_578509 [Pisolithus croceorrhizus]|nr:hypothetical protein EDD16DRAFT_578509 [Pisolithus croceorrhizus]